MASVSAGIQAEDLECPVCFSIPRAHRLRPLQEEGYDVLCPGSYHPPPNQAITNTFVGQLISKFHGHKCKFGCDVKMTRGEDLCEEAADADAMMFV